MNRHYGKPQPKPQPMWQSGPTVDHTALLCSACRVLTRMGYDFDENPALSQWWAAHQKEDAKK